jgi:(S)-3,5-dihydroxyphenylglycine transaminase
VATAATPPVTPLRLRAAELHPSLRDPQLDSMNFLNEVVGRYPRAISFAPGRPHLGLFEPERIGEYVERYATHLACDHGHTPEQVHTSLFQYGRTNGQIHDLVARTVGNDEGIHVPPEAVVVTVGAQEGMLLVVRALFGSPDDVLVVSDPCYVGIGGVARLLEVPMEPAREGPAGLDAAALRAAVARVRAAGRRPRAVYVVPDFANPSGVSLDVAARRELLAVADQEDLVVIEDNPYGFFARDGRPRPTLKSLDRSGRVVYLGSFAKTCFPGARVGYVLADQPVVGVDDAERLLADELSKIKSMTTVNTPSLSQAVIGGMLLAHDCRLRPAVAPAAAFYRANLEVLLAELDRHFPAGSPVRWNVPDGGFFLVVQVPFAADEDALRRSAEEFGVLWTPMRHFYLDAGGENHLRLSCSALPPDLIRDGVARLAAFVAAESHRSGTGVPTTGTPAGD